MKKLTLIFCIFMAMALLPATASAYGNISVSSTPSGATILLNGSGTGQTTSATLNNIPAGSHTILLQLTGYQDYSQSVTVTNGETSTVSATLAAVASAPTISSITPSSGFNTSLLSITNLAGTGFSTTGTTTVVLRKSGQTNITATDISVESATKITCNFLLTNKPTGLWDVIVINPDGQSAVLASGFEIKSSSTATLSAITPTSSLPNTTVSITDLAGTGFVSTSATSFYLKRSGYNNIPGTVSTVTSTKITGAINLNDRTPGSYQVCVQNSGSDAVCGLTFTILSESDVNGSIYCSSNPSGATIFLGSTNMGETPMTLYNVTPGTHTVRFKKSGYADWDKTITVTAGEETDVYGYLDYVTPATTTATTATTAPATTATTVKTPGTSSVTAPTPWPSDTPTPESPLSAIAIVGAVAVGILAMRKR